MKPTVLLFDIDGTLISTGGVGRRALIRTFDTLFQRPDACSSFSFAGMTDKAIARGGLAAINVEATDENIGRVLDSYLGFLETEILNADRSKYRVHEGMVDAIQAGLDASMAVGLGTGNVRQGAMTKLKRVSLDVHFRFGGFGDDAELRHELIRHGAERGAQQLGVPLSEARVVVIGDTPKDVAAAHAIGAVCIGVGTGDSSAQQLLAAGADWAFDTISAKGAIDTMLTGEPTK